MCITSKRSKKSGAMKIKQLLYYRTIEEIAEYKNKPVKERLNWLEAQMEFFYKAMPAKAKKIRDKLKRVEL